MPISTRRVRRDLLLAIDQAERCSPKRSRRKSPLSSPNLGAAVAREKLAYVVLTSCAVTPIHVCRAFGSRLVARDGCKFRPYAATADRIRGDGDPAGRPATRRSRSSRKGAFPCRAAGRGGQGRRRAALAGVTLSRLYAVEGARRPCCGSPTIRPGRGGQGDRRRGAEKPGPVGRAELPALVAGLVTDVVRSLDRGAGRGRCCAGTKGFEAGRPSRRMLTEAFVEKRLLTAEGDGISDRVRPTRSPAAHLAPGGEIVAEDDNLIRVRHTLEPIVREWLAAGETDKARHLQISPPLLAGRSSSSRGSGDLSPAMRDFVAASSGAAEARGRREREEQERRLRDAEALALADRRIRHAGPASGSLPRCCSRRPPAGSGRSHSSRRARLRA